MNFDFTTLDGQKRTLSEEQLRGGARWCAHDGMCYGCPLAGVMYNLGRKECLRLMVKYIARGDEQIEHEEPRREQV